MCKSSVEVLAAYRQVECMNISDCNCKLLPNDMQAMLWVLTHLRIHNLILALSLSSCVYDHHLGYMYRTYIFWLKFCFCIEKRKSINGLRPWTPIGGFAPGPHRGPGPHKARTRCARRVFTFCASALNGAPNHPLPTGTHKQSYATD